MTIKRLMLVPFMAMLLMLSACTFLQENRTSARVITQYSTLKVIDGNVDRAVRVEEIATDVKRYASGETLLTVELLIEAIRDQIRWERLDQADTILVNALLLELRNQLTDRLGADVLPEDVRLAVDTVADWVIEAARMSQGSVSLDHRLPALLYLPSLRFDATQDPGAFALPG